MSTIERESGFREDPLTPDMSQVIKRKLEEIEKEGWKDLNVLGIKSLVAKNFYEGNKEELAKIKTEKQLEEFIDSSPWYIELFLNSFRPETVGSMQLNVKKAIILGQKYENKKMSEKEMREILYTLEGGVYYGTLYLSEIINAYIIDQNELNEEWVKVISADYQSGIFSSRNAAFQKQLNELTGSNLTLDGDLGPKTEEVLNDFLKSVGKEKLKVSKNLFEESKTKEFENQDIYKFIKEQYKAKFSLDPEYVIALDNVVSSAKFDSEITSKRYVEGTLSRYRAYCSLLNC